MKINGSPLLITDLTERSLKYTTIIWAEGRPIGGMANDRGSVTSCSSNELSLYHHCHPADGAFNPRDPLVRTISPNILTDMNKEVEKSNIASSKPD